MAKKYLILSATLACTLVAVLYGVFSPKQYETFAILQVAAVRGEVLDSNITITQVINSDGFLDPLRKRMNLKASLKQLHNWIRADCDPQYSRDIVRVRFFLPRPELAAQLTDAMLAFFNDLKKKSYQQRLDFHQKRFELLSSQKQALQEDIARLRQALTSLQAEPNSNAAMLVLLESRLNASESQLMEVSNNLAELEPALFLEESTHLMKVLSPPANPAEQSSPRLWRNALAAAILGLVLGSILVLFSGYLEKGQRSLHSSSVETLTNKQASAPF